MQSCECNCLHTLMCYGQSGGSLKEKKKKEGLLSIFLIRLQLVGNLKLPTVTQITL